MKALDFIKKVDWLSNDDKESILGRTAMKEIKVLINLKLSEELKNRIKKEAKGWT